MRPEEALRRLLLASAEMTALVGTRIYPIRAPQTAPKPYVTFNEISADHQEHMRGSSGCVSCRVQFDIIAETYAAVKAIGDRMRLTLQGYSGTVAHEGDSCKIQSISLAGDYDGNEPPTPGTDQGPYRIIQDYKIGHAETVPTF